jgi:hypothetical protein
VLTYPKGMAGIPGKIHGNVRVLISWL